MFETRPRSRTLPLVVGVLILVALLADTVIWVLACRRLDDGAQQAAAAAGWTLSSGAARWSGWPVAAELILPDATLRAGPDIIPPLTWTAPRASMRLTAWHPTVLTVSATGRQSLAVGAAPPVPFTAQRLLATIDLTAHDPVRVDADALDVTAPKTPVRVASATLSILPDGLSAGFAGITLFGPSGQPIEPPIQTLRVDGRITPPIEPQPTATASAQRWRAAGGKLDLGAVSLRWGPLDASAHATLTLDQALQPVVTGQVTATGLAAVIEQLAQTGAMTRSAATAAQAMLVILSAPTGGGPVTLPVTVQNGVVTLARIPLLRLPPLAWD